jgi:hypothetical protein
MNLSIHKHILIFLFFYTFPISTMDSSPLAHHNLAPSWPSPSLCPLNPLFPTPIYSTKKRGEFLTWILWWLCFLYLFLKITFGPCFVLQPPCDSSSDPPSFSSKLFFLFFWVCLDWLHYKISNHIPSPINIKYPILLKVQARDGVYTHPL